MSDWQPIETAPKDGGWLLLNGDGPGFRKCTVVGYWGKVNTGDTLKFGDEEMWRRTFGGEPMRPTHWMPLPEPPEEDE